MHCAGTVAPDGEEEEDLSDMEEGDDADATSAKQLSKKQQVNRPCNMVCKCALSIIISIW